MGAGVKRVLTGAAYGTGAAKSIRTVGFRPQKVEVFNQSGLCHAVWTESMADASAMKTVTAGTITFITSNGVTPLSDGFTLGADTDLNVADELFHWVAYE